MNYIVVFRSNGKLNSLYFRYRDETDVTYKTSTLISDEDDVIEAMLNYFKPDNNDMVIRETLLDVDWYKERQERITEQLRRYLDE